MTVKYSLHSRLAMFKIMFGRAFARRESCAERITATNTPRMTPRNKAPKVVSAVTFKPFAKNFQLSFNRKTRYRE